MNKFVTGLFPGWFSVENYSFSPLERVWIIWHPSLLVIVLSKSLEMITVEVSWPSCQSKVIIYVIYASNDTAEREGLWAEISALVSLLDLDNKPWHLLGDFNQIRDLSEHSKPLFGNSLGVTRAAHSGLAIY